jgi:carbonic anhydrase
MTTSRSVPAGSGAATGGGTVTDRLVEANARYAAAFADPGTDARPVLRVAVASVRGSMPQLAWRMRTTLRVPSLRRLTVHSRTEPEAEAGRRPAWAVESFRDVDQDVRQSMARVRTSPFVPRTDDVRGFVFGVRTGLLREIDPA